MSFENTTKQTDLVVMGESVTSGEEAGSSSAEEAGVFAMAPEEVLEFVTDLEQRVMSEDNAVIHVMLSLNRILRIPNAEEVFDDELKGRCRDLWTKVKASGLKVADPPLLFS